MCLESEIKRLARTGHSKQHACELLGMSRGRFNGYSENGVDSKNSSRLS